MIPTHNLDSGETNDNGNARCLERMAKEHAATWSEGTPEKIAELFVENGTITGNSGEPHAGCAEISENAKELLATFPRLIVHCRETRHAGDGAIFIWTLEGNHAETGNPVSLPDWHERELDDHMKVKRCRRFFDAGDYEGQITGK